MELGRRFAGARGTGKVTSVVDGELRRMDS